MTEQPTDSTTKPKIEPTDVLVLEAIRDEFAAFFQALNPKWTIPEFHMDIFETLMAREDCIISMPPDHSKSTIASVFFPAWYWGKNPSKRVIVAVGSPKLASIFGIQIKQVFEHALFKEAFPLAIRRDSDNITMKHSIQRGSFAIVTKGSSIAGMRGDLIIFDDLIGSAAEASSQAERDNAWNFLTRDLFTRATPTAQRIGIGTRWHDDDVLCRLEKSEEFKDFKNLKFKAIKDDGTALWPERHDLENLEGIRKILGTNAFEALYQQNPVSQSGNLIKRHWWQWYKTPPNFRRIIQFMDCAQKVGLTNDFSVCATWGEAENGYFLLDLWRARVEAPDLERAAMSNFAKWTPNALVIEDKSSGSSLIQALKRKSSIPVIPYNPGQRDKLVRASAATPLIESGRCFLPEGSPWVEDFILEHERFPKGTHDDQVDTTSMMAEYFQGTPQTQPRVRFL